MVLLSIGIGLLGLGLLAAAHEIGHFVVARALGVKVYELSIFVGPSLVNWKRNGTEYHIRLIPFGAYVRFSEYDEESEAPPEASDELINQPRWKRLLVSVAGPVTNVLLGMIILAVLFSVSGFLTTRLDEIVEGSQMSETEAVAGDRIISVNGSRVYTLMDVQVDLSMISNTDTMRIGFQSETTGKMYEVQLIPTVKQVYMLGITRYIGLNDLNGWEVTYVDPNQNEGSPVIQVGDTILSVAGVSVDSPDIGNLIGGSEGDVLIVTVIRDGKEMDVDVKPFLADYTNDRGIYAQEGSGISETLREVFLYPVSLLRSTGTMIRSAFQEKVEPYNVLGGPVGMISVVSDVVDEPNQNFSEKAEQLTALAGVISIALAITNMLPLPGLDGNAIVLLAVEMIRGKKISYRTEQVINVIGFVIIVALVIFALASDIIRLTR
jgi:regulator of sigma E protease